MSRYLSKDQVLEVAARFVNLAVEVQDGTAAESIQTQLEQYRLGLFRIVVVGEVKKGKSSFINALLGTPDLLPTASGVATSTVYKLMYGSQKKIKVFGLPPDSEEPAESPPPVEISAEELVDYGTEKGNPGNSKMVDFIGVQLPHPLLKGGVAIIDTPGLGGLFEWHRDITWRYVPNADAIFFVLDSVEAVISQAEVDMLLELRKKNPLIFFVQTKIDCVEESQWKQWRERNLSILSDKLDIPAEKLIYFPVSAKLKHAADANRSSKHLDRSGYSALLYFLYEKLLARKEDQLGRRLISSITIETQGIRRKLRDALHIAATETKEGLDELERSFVETKGQFEQWRSTGFQAAITAFHDQAGELKKRTRETLQERLDPSPYGTLVKTVIDQLRGGEFDPQEMNMYVDTILGACVDQCSEIVMEVQGQYNDQIHGYLDELSSSIGKSLLVQSKTPITGDIQHPGVETLNMQFSGLDEISKVVGGGMYGFALTGFLGSVFPPLAAAATVATVVGVAVMSWKARTDLKVRRKEEALAKLQNVLSDTVRRAQSQALRQFETIAAEYERGVRDALQRAMGEVESEISGKVHEIAEQRQRTREEASNKAGSIKQALESTNEVLKALERLLPPEPSPEPGVKGG